MATFDTQGPYLNDLSAGSPGDPGPRDATTTVPSMLVDQGEVVPGQAVGFGSSDRSVRLGGRGFAGIVQMNKAALRPTVSAGRYASVLRSGSIRVLAATSVSATDTVTFDPSTGEVGTGFSEVIPGAEFERGASAGQTVMLTLRGVAVSASAPSLPPVDLTAAGGSLALPADNNVRADADKRQVIVQPTDQDWFDVLQAGTERSIFMITSVPLARLTANQSFGLWGAAESASRKAVLMMRGLRFGSVGREGVLSLFVGNVSVDSPVVDEERILIVAKRADGTNTMSVIWISLETGVVHRSGQTINNFGVPRLGAGDRAILGERALDDATTPYGPGDGNGWPGEVEALGHVSGVIPDTVWQQIALGGDIVTELEGAGGTIDYLRLLDGTAAGLAPPASVPADTTLPMTVDGNQTLRPGSTIRRQSPNSYLVIDPIDDGYVWGVAPGATNGTVRLSGAIAGRTGALEAQVFYGDNGAIVQDWTTAVADVTGLSGPLQIDFPGPLMTGWGSIRLRTSGEPDQITEIRSRVGVGYKILGIGQSQLGIWSRSSALGITADDALYQSVSFAKWRDDGDRQTDPQISWIGTEAQDGLMALVTQLRSYTSAPIMILTDAMEGSGPDELMDDRNGNRNWSDLEQLLGRYGTDISEVAMNWITQGHETWGTAGETLEALTLGTGPAWDALVADNGGSTVGLHNLSELLDPGWGFVLSPGTRSSTSPYEPRRGLQRVAARALGFTVGPAVSDFEIGLDGSGGGPHQLSTGQGSRRLGMRLGEGIARGLGLSTSQDPSVAGAAWGVDQSEIVVSFNLPNGGSLTSPAPTAIRSFEVDDGGVGTYADDTFSAAISGNTVVLSKTTGQWSGDTVVRLRSGGSLRANGDADAERAIVEGMLYETWAGDTLGLGMPITAGADGREWVSAPLAGSVVGPSLFSAIAITGHSISDIMEGGLDDLAVHEGISGFQRWDGTGPFSSAEYRWRDDRNPASSALETFKTQVLAGGYDVLIGTEAMAGDTGLATFVDDFGNPPASAFEYATIWHDAAWTAANAPHYYLRWYGARSITGSATFDLAWRNNLVDLEIPRWDQIFAYVNANKMAGSPDMLPIHADYAFAALWDRIDAGTITSIASMDDLFVDDVHADTDIGKWFLSAMAWATLQGTDPAGYPLQIGAMTGAITTQQRTDLAQVITDVIADPAAALGNPVEPAGPPDSFSAGQWSVAATGNSGEAAITITQSPNTNGSTLTDIRVQIGGSGPYSSIGAFALDTPIVFGGLTDGVETGIRIRVGSDQGPSGGSNLLTVTTDDSNNAVLPNPTETMGAASTSWISVPAGGMFQDGGTTPAGNGDPVDWLPDQNGGAAYRSNAGAQRPVLDTVSVPARLVYTTNTIQRLEKAVVTSGAPYYYYAVLDVTDTTVSVALQILSGRPAGAGDFDRFKTLEYTSFGGTRVQVGSGPGPTSAVAVPTPSGMILVEAWSDGTDHALSINGAPETVSTPTAVQGAIERIYLGSLFETAGFALSEFFWCDRVPTAGERADLQAWAASIRDAT